MSANNERYAGRPRTDGPHEPSHAMVAEREGFGETSERMREGISSARSIGIGESLAASPSHTTVRTDHVHGGSAD